MTISRSLQSVRAGILIAAAAALTSGCTVMQASFPAAQSHFAYPNSNITPIGHVKGSASITGLMPVVQDADMEEQAIQNALAQKGGDVLVDYTMTTKVTMLPLMFINIYTTDLTVEGTATKMEIGKKALH